MSESVSTPSRFDAAHRGAVDRDVFAQVEKWLALIRELNREQAKAN